MTFTNNRGVHGARAAEYAIMAVLMLNNRVPEMVTHQRAGRWEQTFNTGIAGKTLLVVGVGSVGGSVAEWAGRFGMRVLGLRRTAQPHPAVDEMRGPEALLELIPRADYIIATRARHGAYPPPDRRGGDRGDPAGRGHRQLRPRRGGRLRGAAPAAGAARDQRRARRVRPRAAARRLAALADPPI